MPELELPDIQGLIVRGYSDLPACCFLLLQVREAGVARRWVNTLVDSNVITRGDQRQPDTAVNLAFTCEGLRALGLGADTLNRFSLPFREGMTATPRPRILGDHGASGPETWTWGGPRTPAVHALLLLYAPSAERLESLCADHAARLSGAGVALIGRLDTRVLEERKEHFGFHDGISQPLIKELLKPGDTRNSVRAGEFVLGYPNQYGQLAEGPVASGRDLGRNGSYLVFRQLRQDVFGFWKFLDDQTKQPGGSADPAARVRLAAKMVGRWPDGSPLVLAPHRDQVRDEDKNAFLYHSTDPHGERCPIGAHIRRTNPRGSMGPEPQESQIVANRHGLLRRGRAYGPAIDPAFNPDAILRAGQDGTDRGLHFLCFNADIGRQFEFVQQTWINSPKFEGLYADGDPLLGDHDPRERGITGTFIAQASPIRRRVLGVPRFVTVKGGGYFFLPGLDTLEHLCRS